MPIRNWVIYGYGYTFTIKQTNVEASGMASILSSPSPLLLGGSSVTSRDVARPFYITATSLVPCRAELSSEKNHLRHVCSRRFWSVALAASFVVSTLPAQARDRRNKKDIPLDDYQTSSEGLKYYDFVEGKGGIAEKGQTVLVHFDCMYRGIDAVSSRESKILGGNRIIAQPYELIVGSPPGKERKREFVENANGLFSAQAAPKPPPALYSITEGMHVGGKRRVVVPPALGYGSKGSNEIPPDATFQMDIELLEIKNGASS